MKPLDQTTIIEACKEPKLFAPAFRSGWFKKTDESWLPWFAFLKALFGLPMDEAELAIFKQCTGLDTPPDGGVFEAALICGRRSGKSRTMALIAAYLGTMVDWSPYLAKGERGTVVVVATGEVDFQRGARVPQGQAACAFDPTGDARVARVEQWNHH